jgi:hypothetical protein
MEPTGKGNKGKLNEDKTQSILAKARLINA